MEKKVLPIFILLMMISFVSAEGLGDLLDQIDQSTLILGVIFIVSFSILFFSLSKMLLKDNPTISGIVSLALALLLTYAANKSDFNFEGFFYDIGISESALSLILTLLIISGIILMIIKFKEKENIFAVLGGLFFVASFFVYTKFIFIVIGIILLIIWVFVKSKKGGKNSPKYMNPKYMNSYLHQHRN